MPRFWPILAYFGLFVLSSLPVAGQAPGSVHGLVIDSETGEPLPGVNVYLSGYMRGAATDIEGAFQIDRVFPGRHELVASLLGFEVWSRVIELGVSDSVQVAIEMSPTAYKLETLEVSSERPKGWKRNVRRFAKLILGFTDNARSCELLNPEVLSFKETKDVLEASAVAPLVFENKALGYRLHVVLDRFRGTESRLDWQVKPRFEELEPRNQRQAKRWQKKRTEAFNGSFRHFLLAASHRRLLSEGFEIHVVPEPGVVSRLPHDDDLASRLATQGRTEYTSQLQTAGILEIRFIHERASRLQRRTGSRQISWVNLDPTPMEVTGQGMLYDLRTVQRHGHWATERLADMLPNDYELPQQFVSEE